MLDAGFVINTYKVLILESDLFPWSQYIMESYNYKDNKNKLCYDFIHFGICWNFIIFLKIKMKN